MKTQQPKQDTSASSAPATPPSSPLPDRPHPFIVTVAGNKGGVGKTTTSVHLAAFFAARGPTLLVDGDPNRSALDWARTGKLPFKAVDERAAAMHAKDADFIVIDTEARADQEELRTLLEACHYLVLPTTPDRMSVKALLDTVALLRDMGAKNYRVLLTAVKPRRRTADEVREVLAQMQIPVFTAQIPDLSVFERAVDEGVVVGDLRGGGDYTTRAASAYKAVGEEILP